MDEVFSSADALPQAEQTENILADYTVPEQSGRPDAMPAAGDDGAEGSPENALEYDGDGDGDGGIDDSAVPDGGGEASVSAVVRAKFNKQVRELSTQEAVPYVEMGMKWESFKPVYEKLRYLAQSGGRSVERMIDGLVAASEQGIYDRALEEAGGNEAAALRIAELQIMEVRRRFEEFKAGEADAVRGQKAAERAGIEKQLADGFAELRAELPGQFKSFSDVPEQVVGLAAEKGISLYDAYLRYERRQSQRENAEKQRSLRTARQSAGGLAGGADAPAHAGAEMFAAAFDRSWF